MTVAGGGATSPAAAAEFRAGEALEREIKWSGAIARYQSARTLAAAANDSITLADALMRIGLVYWTTTQYDSALHYLGTARVIRQQIGDAREYARVLNGIGVSYYQLGIYEPALEAFLEALAIRRTSPDTIGLTRTLTNIGNTYRDWGQLDRAQKMLAEAVAVSEHDPAYAPALGYALNSLAMLAIDRREFNTARSLIERSRTAYGTPGALRSRADTVDSWEINLGASGVLLLREGRPRDAIVLLDSVMASATARGSVRGRARALLHLGESHAALGHTDIARTQFREALQLSRSVSQRVLALEALEALSTLERSANNTSAALAHLSDYQALRDTIFDQDAALRIAAREARAETDAALRANQQLEERGAAQALVISRQRTTLVLSVIIVLLVCALLVVFVRFSGRERARAQALTTANRNLETLNADLRSALSEVRTLSGLIPICANCKRVRDDRGYWAQVETFVAQHSNATFSHSICQSCGPALYGELWPDRTGEIEDRSESGNSGDPTPTRPF